MAEAWAQFMRDVAGQKNPRLGVRFDATGTFLREEGNTIVAQVIAGSATEAALIDLRAALRALPYGHLFAYTVPESYHMTVFEGVIETRRQASHWPSGMDPMAGIDETTMAMAARLEDFGAPPPFAMRVAEVTPFGLNLTGATAEDEANARAWRDALAECLGLRTPNHDSYGFHTTVAYQMEGMPVEAIAGYEEALAGLTAVFRPAFR